MTGTPSKDRAEAHMAVARELALSSEGIYRAAEFEALARAIAAALDKAFAEGMKRAAEIAQHRADLSRTVTMAAAIGLLQALPDAILAEIGEG